MADDRWSAADEAHPNVRLRAQPDVRGGGHALAGRQLQPEPLAMVPKTTTASSMANAFPTH
jgi:hypothetical protein